MIKDTFDRVVIVSLDRRPDRRERLQKELSEMPWPFREPIWFRAIDGSKLPKPYAWVQGFGTWGCRQSHVRILEDAIMDGVESLLVLEDDAEFEPDFKARVMRFLQAVPDDWHQLMIGGQLFENSTNESVVPGMVRKVTRCERTHCYAVRGEYLRALYSKWASCAWHVDWAMGAFQQGWNVYAPERFLVRQSAGKSDISGADNQARSWNPPKAATKVFWLRASREIFEHAKTVGYHPGRFAAANGADRGLHEICTSAEADDQKAKRLSDWIAMIDWESASFTPERSTLLWHPELTLKLATAAAGERLRIIDANKPEQVPQWPAKAKGEIGKKCGGCNGGTGVAKTIRNAAGAVKRVLTAIAEGDPLKVDADTWKERLKICRACEHYTLPFVKCAECGCFVKPKTALATESCPLGKWGPEKVTEAEGPRDIEEQPKPMPTPKKKHFNDRWFGHSGDIGDVIYALPTIREAGGGKLFLYHQPGKTAHAMTPEVAESLRSLLLKQDYIEEVAFSDAPRNSSINGFRHHIRGVRNLADAHLATHGFSEQARSKKWLTVEPRHIAPVVIARSPRYHGQWMPWKRIVETYKGRAIFVGFLPEWEAFCSEFGHVPYHRTANLLELAEVIAGSKLFVGNQSCHEAIAEGLKQPKILEMSSQAPNSCIFKRIGAVYCADQRPLELPEV